MNNGKYFKTPIFKDGYFYWCIALILFAVNYFNSQVDTHAFANQSSDYKIGYLLPLVAMIYFAGFYPARRRMDRLRESPQKLIMEDSLPHCPKCSKTYDLGTAYCPKCSYKLKP